MNTDKRQNQQWNAEIRQKNNASYTYGERGILKKNKEMRREASRSLPTNHIGIPTRASYWEFAHSFTWEQKTIAIPTCFQSSKRASSSSF